MKRALAYTAASAAVLTAVAAVPVAAGQVSISMITWDSGSGLVQHQEAVNLFEKQHPNIKVNIESVPTGEGTKLLTEIGTGTAPDIMQLGDSSVAQFVNLHALLNLEPFIKGKNGLDVNIFLPNVYKVGVVHGKPYLLTKNWADLAVLYNKTLFEKAHVPFPTNNWTWQQFYEDAKRLTIRKDGRTVQWGVQLPGDWLRGLEPIIYQSGGSILNPQGTKAEGYLDSPKTVRAFEFYARFYREGLAPSPATLQNMPGVDLFQSGKVAMYWFGPWTIQVYQKDKSLKFGVVELPRGPAGRADSICWAGFGIYARTPHPQQAWDLLKFLAGPVGDKIYAQEGFPAVKSVAHQLNLSNNPYWGPFIDQTRYLHPLEPLKTDLWPSVVAKDLQPAVDKIIETNGNIAQILHQTAVQIDKDFALNRGK